MEILYGLRGKKTVFTRSATTPPHLNEIWSTVCKLLWTGPGRIWA